MCGTTYYIIKNHIDHLSASSYVYRLFSYFKLHYNIVRMLDVKQIKLHECGFVLICQQDMFK